MNVLRPTFSPLGTHSSRTPRRPAKFPRGIPPHPARAWGFTLLEMLVGLTLLGFVVLLLFSGLRLATRSWDAGETRIESVAQQALTFNFIRSLLEQAAPLRWRIDGEEQVAFFGGTDALDWIAPLPGPEGEGPRVLLRLTLRPFPGEPGGTLFLSWRLYDVREPGFARLDTMDEKKERPLVKHVRQIEWAYFGSSDGQGEPAWHAQWRERKQLPELVRLRILPMEGEPWLDILAAPRLRVE